VIKSYAFVEMKKYCENPILSSRMPVFPVLHKRRKVSSKGSRVYFGLLNGFNGAVDDIAKVSHISPAAVMTTAVPISKKRPALKGPLPSE
jgi:hypothetical protein